MNTHDSAQRYLDKIPPASEGGRNDALNKAAYALVERFSLTEAEHERLLFDWSQKCSPPIAEHEALKTIRSAWQAAQGKGTAGAKARAITPQSRVFTKQSSNGATPGPRAPKIETNGQHMGELPAPMPSGAAALISSAFHEGEGVRISHGHFDPANGDEVPDSGLCISREEWLRKLAEVDGDPNRIYRSSKRTGLFIGVNPMKLGGTKDSDVTGFRHALIEFDKGLSPAEQLRLYQESKLPCAAVIFSGGKSVHAWVKVDAVDRKEYDERVKFLFDYFEAGGYTLDKQNKNPSRFSRLPNCIRFDKRQELLALNVGCESWSDWLVSIQQSEIAPCQHLSEFLRANTALDPNNVIGVRGGRTLRYLCKGKAAWLIGPSGIGKSSLIAEFAIAWAMGRPLFGITPARPLKSLIIQAENDFYDLAEMVQGIAAAHDLDPDPDWGKSASDMFAAAEENVLFQTESSCIQRAFVERLHRLIDRDKPDIVWADPLLSFAGIDVSKQEQCSMFLREWLNPVLEATGVVLIGVHHTGKPKGAKETKGWSIIDYAYSGLGSSELVNWARAVMVLRPLTDYGQYELKLAKRGNRAGARHPNEEPTTSVYLSHSRAGIRWQQIDPPAEPVAGPDVLGGGKHKGGRPPKVDRVAMMNTAGFLAGCKSDGEGKNEIAARLRVWLGSKDAPEVVGLSVTASKSAIERLQEAGKLALTPEEKYIKGANA